MSDTGKRIAVLGGCGGIGRGVVAACRERGDRVAVIDLAQSIARHPVPDGVAAYAFEAGDDAALRAAFAAIDTAWGGLDGFVNLAGFLIGMTRLADVPVEDFVSVVDGNLRTAFVACNAVMPLLEKGDAPSLVNAVSGLAQYIRPLYGPYATAKAGLFALTKTLALEHAPRVRANAIGPGAVDTAFLHGGTGRSDENEPTRLNLEAYSAGIPLKRIATVDDVVGPILFLLGSASAYMTGQCLWINGGAYMP